MTADIHRIADSFCPRWRTALRVVTAVAAVGASFVPWLIGGVGDAYGLRDALMLLGAHAWLISGASLALLRADRLRVRSVPSW